MQPVDQVAVEDKIKFAHGVGLFHGGQEIVCVCLVSHHLPLQAALLNFGLHHAHEGMRVVKALDLTEHLGQFDANPSRAYSISKTLHRR